MYDKRWKQRDTCSEIFTTMKNNHSFKLYIKNKYVLQIHYHIRYLFDTYSKHIRYIFKTYSIHIIVTVNLDPPSLGSIEACTTHWIDIGSLQNRGAWMKTTPGIDQSKTVKRQMKIKWGLNLSWSNYLLSKFDHLSSNFTNQTPAWKKRTFAGHRLSNPPLRRGHVKSKYYQFQVELFPMAWQWKRVTQSDFSYCI